MNIRKINLSDAAAFCELLKQVDESSEYMLWEAGERSLSPEQQQKMIENINRSNNSTILVAESEQKLVGYLIAFGGNARRNRHTAYLVIGISESHRGQGVGTALFEEMEQWATEHNIHRLELTVITRNESGVALYRKMGFEVEGVKRESIRIGTEYVDEYYMSKLIE